MAGLLDVEDLEFAQGGFDGPGYGFGLADVNDGQVLRPINWNLLTAEEALLEWADLDAWVVRLSTALGIDPAGPNVMWAYMIPEQEVCYDKCKEFANAGCSIIFSTLAGMPGAAQGPAKLGHSPPALPKLVSSAGPG